jgi:hypothetical protein
MPPSDSLGHSRYVMTHYKAEYTSGIFLYYKRVPYFLQASGNLEWQKSATIVDSVISYLPK